MNGGATGLQGLRIFVVEDEALVAMNLEMMLEELGCAVVGPAMRFDAAEAMLAEGVAVDAAVLDVNVGGRPVFPLAERLAAAGIPVVFATGYGREGLAEGWATRPVLQKPYLAADLARALRRALAD
ncbi:response regulator [Aquibium sp. A9E412]|uniref:response regulator n=1 Tax=Aquibium sp. A9E412 TaxID=2976767 RepID=UPI0025B1B433|nr:response regulator [Aquibium sp. A9E412]MDN2566857.1 response regulator [Aquibium sp. A9E412]